MIPNSVLDRTSDIADLSRVDMQAAQEKLGAGLGLKREILEPLQTAYGAEYLQDIQFLEIAPENWLGAGGRSVAQLQWLREHYPLVCHGLCLSLGGPDPLNVAFLKQIKAFLEQYKIDLYTEHLSYCTDVDYLTTDERADVGSPQRGYLYDLLPIPFTEEAVLHVAGRIRQTQDILERRIAVENASYYVAAPISQMSEPAFVKAVLEEADCDLHLDLNNIYVNSVNFNFDPVAYLEHLEKAGLGQRIVYAHIAGHYQEAVDLIIDTHGEAVIDPVWELLEQAYARFGTFPTLLERDTNIPELSVMAAEVSRIAQLQRQAAARRGWQKVA